VDAVPTKTRRKLTLKDKLAALDVKIRDAGARLDALVQQRAEVVAQQKAKADAILREIEE